MNTILLLGKSKVSVSIKLAIVLSHLHQQGWLINTSKAEKKLLVSKISWDYVNVFIILNLLSKGRSLCVYSQHQEGHSTSYGFCVWETVCTLPELSVWSFIPVNPLIWILWNPNQQNILEAGNQAMAHFLHLQPTSLTTLLRLQSQ